MTTKGEVSTLAGLQQGFADGNGNAAKFGNPKGICFDKNSQSLLVCDHNNNKLRRVQLNGTSPSHPAHSLFIFFSDHPAGEVTTLCDIQGPVSVAVTVNQTILVSTAAHTLQKVTHKGTTHQTYSQHQNKETYADT